MKKNNKVKIKKKINKNRFNNKMILLIVGIILFIMVGIGSYYLYLDINGEAKYLKIKLNGNKEITLEYGEEYNDELAKAFYKNKDISKDIKVKSNLNKDKLGSYQITYSIAYKKQKKEVIRKINVVDNTKPSIELNGKEEISLYVGDTYNEENAKALDNYDGDITDKIVISGAVDTNKIGEYIITYKVNDSSNNESSIDRKIKVSEKPKPVATQKVAVLNYHFFYETDEENKNLCGSQSICLKMDRFRQHLKWLNDNNYKTLTMKEFVSWMYGEISIPEKSVLITIDDGALGTGRHNGNHLIPALEEYKVHATLFLITGWWDIANYSSPYLDVESHTHTLHVSGGCNATCIGYDGLIKDLKKSIAITKSTDAFCFPFYSYSDEAIRAVKDVGFKVAFIGGNRKASRNDDKYKIPRYPIYDSTTMEQFKNMVN